VVRCGRNGARHQQIGVHQQADRGLVELQRAADDQGHRHRARVHDRHVLQAE
jgi:hypothetical protein